jgi:hypothetical protein
MRTTPGTNLLIPIVLLLLLGVGARGQTPTPSEWETWPKVQASIELRKQTRLLVYGELQNGEEFGYLQWKTGALLNYRTKRIANRGQSDIDDENEYNLVVGAGYEYLQTIQNGKTKGENRIIVQSTPRHRPGAGFLLQDRNRAEFRWVNGVYDFRYRNRLTVDRAFRVSNFRFTPYASGELFWDRNHHSWNENQYSFGVQFPYKSRLMLDTFYLRQNCTTCSQNPLNVWGVTLNLYFRRKK